MKNSAINIRIILGLAMLLFGLGWLSLGAQSYNDGHGRFNADDNRYTIPGGGQTYRDLRIPPAADGKYLYLRVEGADGGYVHMASANKKSKGGAGATVEVCVPIGDGSGEVPVGALFRFIIGEKGGNSNTVAGSFTDRAAGAGGGTGVAFLPSIGDKWQLLAVAGAGSGAVGQCWVGHDGRQGRGIVATVPGTETGTGGHVFPFSVSDYGEDHEVTGGGGAFQAGYLSSGGSIKGGEAGWVDGPDSGMPTGGDGFSGGGWGFGGGGGRYREKPMHYTGGGGGYEGGSAINFLNYGNYQYKADGTTIPEASQTGYGLSARVGDGGASFYHKDYVISGFAKYNGTTSKPGNGFVEYQFLDNNPIQAIKFASNTGKCIDDYGSHTGNGNNIQTYNCTGNSNQKWYFSLGDRSVRLAKNLNKCLDLDHSDTANGTNIQLWDCNGTDAQKWLYNGIHKTIHSDVNSDKCFDATNGSYNPSANVNLQLWDCGYTNNNQKWNIDGATTVSNPANVKHIVPVLATSFAVHSHEGNVSGSNIQLWTKDNTNYAEQWYFDGLAIKMRDHQNLCVDLSSSSTSNGNNIQLYNCNGTNAQKWIYDGMTKTIRSVINPDKCMQIEKNTDGAYGKRSNVEIYDCNGSDQQRFMIQE